MFQVGTTGHKNRLIIDMNTASDFHEQLTNFVEHYASLGTIYIIHSDSSNVSNNNVDV